MKRFRHFSWAALAALTALFAANSQAATLVLQSQSSTVHVGDEFRIDVILQDAFDGEFIGDTLLAFGFNLSFDGGALSLLSSNVGAGWDDDSPFLDVDVAGSSFPGISMTAPVPTSCSASCRSARSAPAISRWPSTAIHSTTPISV
jgi:hypothetical protein